MSSQIKLQQPVINGSLRSTNFFNGRLVTGADMSREQTARRDGDRLIGKAAGEGIVFGLEVEKEPTAGDDPIINVSKGLAINRCGQSLNLPQDLTVNLLQRFGAAEQPSQIFSECQPISGGTYAVNYGIYLLVLSPVESSEGSAPTSGLNNVFSVCNTDVILETVQFRLFAVDPYLTNETLPDDDSLRNYLAYRCFGTAEMQKFFTDPFNTSIENYGLIDDLRDQTLSDSDVPLAIIHWNSGGVQFVEKWAVRRRVTQFSANKDWSFLTSDRRQSESEAMYYQFAEQVRDIRSNETNLHQIAAKDRFTYLPPLGILPLKTPVGGLTITNSSVSKGFSSQVFFDQLEPEEAAMLDAARFRQLISESFQYDPIDLRKNEKVRLYLLWENVRAVETGVSAQLVLIFTKQTLPYRGTARFGYSKFDLSRIAEVVT